MSNLNLSFDLIRATTKDIHILNCLWPFYVYDLTRYCGHLNDWVSPTDLSFKKYDLSPFFRSNFSPVYLIQIKEEYAGFVIITKISAMPEVDWYMQEFFIISKFQRHGLGEKVAMSIFKQLAGKWAVGVLLDNSPALAFWRKVIKEYTQDNYIEEIKTSAQLRTKEYPDPYPMVMLQFTSGRASDSTPDKSRTQE